MRRIPIILTALTILVSAGSSLRAQSSSSGTAFAVAPETVVTNDHVVAGCTSIEVVSLDGRRKATVLQTNSEIDIAIIKVAGIPHAVAKLRTGAPVRLGEPVMVFGYPLDGLLTSGGNFTSGIVSGLRGLRDAANELQFTAPVQPGNSGGPLLDSSGLVVGVVRSKLSLNAAVAMGDIPQNVNFGIKLEALSNYLTAQKIPFATASPTTNLTPATVAEQAQQFTHRVECIDRDSVVSTRSERAILYEEDTRNPNGRRYAGTVRWETRPTDDQADATVVAVAEFATRKLGLTLTFSRNRDQRLPASHLVDLKFASAGVPQRDIKNVPGLLMKSAEATRGAPLAGISVAVGSGQFLIGLSSRSDQRQTNMKLLAERSWFDIPFYYSDGQRAILAIEKGPTGNQAFQRASASWQ